MNASEAAFYKAEVAYNQSALVLNHTVDTIDRLEKFVNSSSSTPAAIRQRATDVRINGFYHLTCILVISKKRICKYFISYVDPAKNNSTATRKNN